MLVCAGARADSAERGSISASALGGDDSTGPAADSVVGVSFFSDTDDEDFGRFDRAFFGLYKILGGESWLEALDVVLLRTPGGLLSECPAGRPCQRALPEPFARA